MGQAPEPTKELFGESEELHGRAVEGLKELLSQATCRSKAFGRPFGNAGPSLDAVGAEQPSVPRKGRRRCVLG